MADVFDRGYRTKARGIFISVRVHRVLKHTPPGDQQSVVESEWTVQK